MCICATDQTEKLFRRDAGVLDDLPGDHPIPSYFFAEFIGTIECRREAAGREVSIPECLVAHDACNLPTYLVDNSARRSHWRVL